MGVSYRDESQLPATRIDHPQALPLADASMDHGDPHIPRRKRSKPTELIRPLELLAAANAAAARAAAGGRQDELEDDYMPDNLSCLAAAAVAESESDAELARAPENGHQVLKRPQECCVMRTRVRMACQQSVTMLPLSEYRCDSFLKQPCQIAKMDVVM